MIISLKPKKNIYIELCKYITLLTTVSPPARSTPSITDTINTVTTVTGVVACKCTVVTIESIETRYNKVFNSMNIVQNLNYVLIKYINIKQEPWRYITLLTVVSFPAWITSPITGTVQIVTTITFVVTC